VDTVVNGRAVVFKHAPVDARMPEATATDLPFQPTGER
jgi:hypothetical protein